LFDLFDQDIIDQMASDLFFTSKAKAVDTEGNRVVLTSAGSIGFPRSNEIVLIYENRGCFFWDGGRAVNQFRLVSAGFNLRMAPALADMLNRLAEALGKRVSEATTRRIEHQEGNDHE
jgi:hypothetical protein